MEIRYSADIVRYKTMTNSELREAFVIDGLFAPDCISLSYSDIDRGIIGSARPLDLKLDLPTHKELASEHFAERREIGIVNIGGPGSVEVDESHFELDTLDSLYIGRGSTGIVFSSNDATNPAKFYFVSYPAHTHYPTTRIPKASANRIDLGEQDRCNKRTIFQAIRPGIVETCQIVMGFTILAPGNVWNTFPPHTHQRRSEYYFYFDMPEDSRLFHFMGEADNLRPIVMKSEEAVVSPIWSAHCGAGTSAYSFVWSMGGENQEFDDMDAIPLTAIA